MSTADDTGAMVPVEPGRVRRVVSLVPSLTESVAATDRALLAGATDWCSHPADLEVPRVRGTKNPDLTKIRALAPDLVLANEEENRPQDLDAIRAAGIPVWVTCIRSVDEAFASLSRLIEVLRPGPEPAWLQAARAAWSQAPPRHGQRAIIPIWRRPWMVVGRDTFAGDVLSRLGVANVFTDHGERYPKIDLPELIRAGADLVVLPDEPYPFAPDDGPECFPDHKIALVSGRLLTWYGPSLAQAPRALLP
jgi:ABC-type Fe3+-hydroxamate transport system substrate-binding protein